MPNSTAGAGAAPGIALADLAERTGALLVGDGSIVIHHVATLDRAGEGAIAFLSNPRYQPQLATTRAAAVIVSPSAASTTSLPKLVSANPYATYARVATLLSPPPPVVPGAHASAVVAASARVAGSAAIGALAVIGAGTTIGERASIGAGTVVGANVTIGDDAILHANVTIYDGTIIGPRAIIHGGAVLGADGFGMAEDNGRWLKIPQLGRVVLGADVEVGANTTIDRGAIEDTVIEDDVKLDNQIQIGHNCRIGAHTAIAGCTGIAGSTRIGRNCRIGGAAMIAGHLDIPDGTAISAGAGIFEAVPRADIYTTGFPQVTHREWKRIAVALRHLPEFVRRLRELERAARRDRASRDALPDAKEDP